MTDNRFLASNLSASLAVTCSYALMEYDYIDKIIRKIMIFG
jgi:hypothetical protein